MRAAPTKAISEELKSFAKLNRASIAGSFYFCFECMKACPAGTSERKL